jgi:hypothetical protein
VRPGVGLAALQAEGLLLHDWGQAARPGAVDVLEAEAVPDLVVDRVPPVRVEAAGEALAPCR